MARSCRTASVASTAEMLGRNRWPVKAGGVLPGPAAPGAPAAISSCAAKGSAESTRDGGGAACSGVPPRSVLALPTCGTALYRHSCTNMGALRARPGAPTPPARRPPSSPLSFTPISPSTSLPPMHQISHTARSAPQARFEVHELGLKGVRRVERRGGRGGGRDRASRPMPLATQGLYAAGSRQARPSREWTGRPRTRPAAPRAIPVNPGP